MLIDSTHPEETRVVVLRGNRVEEFDFESASRKQLRGNIYLAKVTRVEPSLQAAFVDYGGNRHGFLAFSEIHPDYYQIPVADRQALIEEEERAARDAEAEADIRARRRTQRERSAARPEAMVRSEPREEAAGNDAAGDSAAMAACSEVMIEAAACAEIVPQGDVDETPAESESASEIEQEPAKKQSLSSEPTPADQAMEPIEPESGVPAEALSVEVEPSAVETTGTGDPDHHAALTPTDAEPIAIGNVTEVNGNGAGAEEDVVESVGGADAMEEVPERAPRLRRQYKIQEVIKRRQVMLVQVVKEERGTKGAALTTYLSLAGRYCVLMPNTARGGGISRKITDAQDRRRLKDLAQELEVPEGMGVILRTAGATRTKNEIKRDFEYLLRLWETVRDFTLRSTAPTLVYEEGSLIKRSIRDLYNKDIDEIMVAGEDGYGEARDFMQMLMPSHVRNVKAFRDPLPIFTRFGIENQLDAMFQPVVQLRSGGYVVINQTEALVAIDVNSGRATREHHIEDTALKTNLEAAEEIARQLRLRDLAGLIVIDFIDMDEKRNNRTVERRLKEALKSDRARIQVGHISHFGLLEMSRQRIRSSVLESSTEKCPHCGGSGHVRSVSSVALQLLRAVEEMLLKGATHNVIVRTRTEIALYLLNQKRAHLRLLEERFQIAIMINADANIGVQLSYVIEKGEQVHSLEQARAIAAQAPRAATAPEEEPDYEDYEDEEEPHLVPPESVESEPAHLQQAAQQTSHGEGPGGDSGRRRKRRRRGRRGAEVREPTEEIEPSADGASSLPTAENDTEGEPPLATGSPPLFEAETEGIGDEARSDAERRKRRRGRRGGRRNRRDRDAEVFGAPPEPDDSEPDVAGAPGQPEPPLSSAVTDAEAEPPPFTASPGRADADVTAQEHAAAEHPEIPSASSGEESAREDTLSSPAQPAGAKEPEKRRRRSTVREPAPTTFHGESGMTSPVPLSPPAELPQPIVTDPPEPETAERPRRSGWWNKRALGKS
jgi:ribonuclease E